MKNNKIIIVSSLIILILVSYTIYKIYNEKGKMIDYSDNLNVYCFNVGKADSFIIRKDDKIVMIDTAEESNANEIISYLNANDINKIDYLIITHFDKDHVGGAAKIIESIEVSHILQSNVPKKSEYYNNYIEELIEEEITPITVTDNYTFDLNGVSFYVDGPKKEYDKKSSNNSSLIVKVKYKDNNLLFMGDAMDDRINDFIETNNETFDFLKIPYHGHFQDKLMDLFNETKPKYAVISSNKEDDELVDLLKFKSIKYYLTRKGDILFSFDGKKVYVDEY